MIIVICILAIVTSAHGYYVPQTRENVPQRDCKPNHVYASETITCICNKAGAWPHKDCQPVFGNLSRTNDTEKCDPDGYAVVECNVCRCTSSGQIDYSRCTKNVCEDEARNITENLNYRRADGVLGSCVATTWYSMAPCQYCYCANKNKLLCNTGGVSKSELQLGSYKLSVCETDLQQDINALYPKPLRDGIEPTVVTKAAEAVEAKADEAIDEDFAGIDAKSIDAETYKADEKDEEKEIESLTTPPPTVSKPVKGNVTKASKKKVLRKEKLSKTINQPATTTPKPEESSDDDNDISASNDKVDVGLNLDLGQPAVDSDQIDDDPPEKMELKEKPASAEIREKTETKDVEIFSQPGTLSDMLDKFIHLAIRKSMMTIKPGDSCVPGTEARVGCNLCFCLKNGKLLCTNKSC